jgi:hypothetical protein
MYLKLYGTIRYRYWNLSSAISSAICNPLPRRQSATNPLYAIYYLGRAPCAPTLLCARYYCPTLPRSLSPITNAACSITHAACPAEPRPVLVVPDDGVARAPLLVLVLVVLARHRSPPAPTRTPGIDQPCVIPRVLSMH